MLITLLVTADGLPAARVLLTGITTLSRLPVVRSVRLTRLPLRYRIEVDGQVDPTTLAAALAEVLELPVQVQAVRADAVAVPGSPATAQ